MMRVNMDYKIHLTVANANVLIATQGKDAMLSAMHMAPVVEICACAMKAGEEVYARSRAVPVKTTTALYMDLATVPHSSVFVSQVHSPICFI